MRNTRLGVSLVLGLTMAARLARGGDLPDPIDLSTFGRGDGPADAITEELENLPILSVGQGLDAAGVRTYVSGIVGASFATLSTGGVNSFQGDTIREVGSVNETIFTGGGALGIAFARPSGQLRMEVEGRARGPMHGQTSIEATAGGLGDGLPLDVTVTNGWSTLVNFWRDVSLFDSLGAYAGGGFGVGGYRYAASGPVDLALNASSNVTTFAWQVGTGFIYDVNDRITIDTGYRFFAMTPDSSPLLLNDPGIPVALSFGQYTNAFSASELLVSVRIYEPFRNWR